MRSIRIEKGIRLTGTLQPAIKRCVVIFFLSDFFWRFYSHLLVSQLHGPPLKFVQHILTFHVYELFNLQNWIVMQRNAAITFDCLLIGAFMWLLFMPVNKLANYLSFILFFLYSIIFPINLAFDAHYLSAMVMVSLIFLCTKKNNFEIGWEALRYYVFWVYESAFLWKLINGSFLDWNSGINVVKNNLSQYLYLNPGTFMSHFYFYCISHPEMINTLTILTYLLEGVFIVGFFTKKFDLWFIFIILLLHFELYLMVDTSFVEWYIFVFPLLPVRFWKKFVNKFHFINQSINGNKTPKAST